MALLIWTAAGLGWLYFWLRGHWFAAVVATFPVIYVLLNVNAERASQVPAWAWIAGVGVPWMPFAIHRLIGFDNGASVRRALGAIPGSAGLLIVQFIGIWVVFSVGTIAWPAVTTVWGWVAAAVIPWVPQAMLDFFSGRLTAGWLGIDAAHWHIIWTVLGVFFVWAWICHAFAEHKATAEKAAVVTPDRGLPTEQPLRIEPTLRTKHIDTTPFQDGS